MTMPNRTTGGSQDLGSELRLAVLRGELLVARGLAERMDPAARKAAARVLSGAEAMRRGDLRSASVLFEQAMDEQGPAGVRWLAAWSQASVLARIGEIEEGEEVAALAMDLAQRLEPLAVSLTACLFAELEALDGAVQPALDRMDAVITELEGQGVQGRKASALARLTQARLLAAVGLERESAGAADAARSLDPSWSEPIIFLSRAAQRLGELERAVDLLRQLRRSDPEVLRELGVLELVRGGEVPLWALGEYQALRDELPADTVVGQLQALASQCPAFPQVRECLGWKLIQLGRHSEARQTFEALEQVALDAELRASVQLGLRCATTEEARRRSVPDATNPGHRAPGDFTGDLGLLPVPDLLEFLRNTRRTGVLVLGHAESTGTICIREGMLGGASSPGFRHVGERLHAIGRVSAEQLALMRPEEPAAAMGWVPVAGIDEDVLGAALSRQIELAVGEMVRWSEGMFSFQPHRHCPRLDVNVQLDTQAVLLDAIRRLDEEARDDARS
jgi:tetratricopeptide (TPR) repeat protein